MTKEQQDTLTVRVTSAGFTILVFALFRPLGMDALGWALGPHLAAIWVLSVGVCYLTEAILRHLFRMPAALDRGVDYIIRRNLRFQLINTPLAALMCCLYLHFPLSPLHSPLTWQGYLTMLLIIAFCSFTIGLYWRFKFRSRFLAAELEEVRLLNEELRVRNDESIAKRSSLSPSAPQPLTLNGSSGGSLTLPVTDLLYIESVGNYVKVNYLDASRMPAVQMLRATSKQMEETLRDHPLVIRCHRAFLVNLAQVERIDSHSGTLQLRMKHTHATLPVSRTHTTHVKSAFTQTIKQSNNQTII